MIKAIVLDIGGVLLRTEDRSGRQQLETRYHLPEGGADRLVFGSEQAHLSTIGKLPPENIWQNVAQTLSLSTEALQEFQNLFWSGDLVDQEAIRFLQTLRPRYKTALLSNAWLHARQDFAERYRLIEGVTAETILYSSELGVAKPNHRIYDILRKTIGVTFNEILFVDDFIENVEAARTLGIQAIHFKTGMNLINQIKSRLE